MKRDHQRGIVLIIILIFLVLLTMLGLTAMQTNVLQERQAGNSRDVNIAFQAAEAALREGENYVLRNVASASAFTAACTGGLCLPSTSATPVWSDSALSVWSNGTNSLVSSNAMFQAVQPARYIVELLGEVPATQGQSIAVGVKPSAGGTAYRVTATGWGANNTTQILLQSIYVKY